MATKKLTTADLVEAFEGSVEPNEISFGYRIGLVLAASVMILLPLAYVVMIVAMGYRVYYHAMAYGENVFHIIPMAITFVLWIFMLKPFFSPPIESQRRRQLTRREAPMLFALVDQICKTIEAPKPVTIHVDCDVNASAGFRSGLRSLFSNDLALTIGLPLVAGLNVRQLSGVITHEFGHFSQGAAMRLTYVVRRINSWFERVVHERDAWDAWLVALSEEEELWYASFFAWPILFGVWVTRKILHLLMLIGRLVSCFMLREMEYDADRYGTRLVGSRAYEDTLRQILILDVAQNGAFSDLRTLGEHGVLADDLPRLIVHNMEHIPDEVHMHIQSMIREGTTGLLSTHPSHRDRIDKVRTYRAPGVFALERPATDLFANFADLSQQLTLEMYREIFGLIVRPDDLINIEKIVGSASSTEIIKRIWLRPFSVLCSYPLPAKLPVSTALMPREALDRVKTLIPTLYDVGAAYEKAIDAFDQVDDIAIDLGKAMVFAEARVAFVPEAFCWPLATKEHRVMATKGIKHKHLLLNKVMLPIEQRRAQRVIMSLWLLNHAQKRVAKADQLKQEADAFLATSHALTALWPQVNRLRREIAVLSALVGCSQEHGEPKTLKPILTKRARALYQQFNAFKNALDGVPSPFEGSDAPLLGEFLSSEPSSKNPEEIVAQGSELLQTLCQIQVRCLGRLSELVEIVEEAFGIEVPESDA